MTLVLYIQSISISNKTYRKLNCYICFVSNIKSTAAYNLFIISSSIFPANNYNIILWCNFESVYCIITIVTIVISLWSYIEICTNFDFFRISNCFCIFYILISSIRTYFICYFCSCNINFLCFYIFSCIFNIFS